LDRQSAGKLQIHFYFDENTGKDFVTLFVSPKKDRFLKFLQYGLPRRPR